MFKPEMVDARWGEQKSSAAPAAKQAGRQGGVGHEDVFKEEWAWRGKNVQMCGLRVCCGGELAGHLALGSWAL